jgi:hypothetical protein
MKREIYCELDFLKRFVENKPLYDDGLSEEISELDIWKKYFKLFRSNSIIKIDKSQEDIKILMEANQCFKILLKKHNEGIIELHFNVNINVPENLICSLFFLTDKEKCKQIEKDYGICAVCNETTDTHAKYLFGLRIPTNKGFVQGDQGTYDFLKLYRHPCNSLIINDRYLLLDHDHYLEGNLLKILEILLPDKLNKTDFHLLIISGDGQKKINIESRYEKIKTEIENRKSYKVQIKIIAKDAAHNRDIITNYIRINAGHKFNLFRQQRFGQLLAQEYETFTFGYLFDEDEEVRTNILSQYNKIVKDTPDEIGTVKYVIPKGTSDKETNRLLTNITN